MDRKPGRWSGLLREASERGNASCVGTDRCMAACPVVDSDVPINELNDAADEPTWMTERVRQFVIDCVMCGRCTPACPAGVQRDEMMLYLRAHMPDRPRKYATYGWLRGGAECQGWVQDAAIKAASRVGRKRVDPRLVPHLDKTELQRKDTLLYFGCYAFSETKSATCTLDIARELGVDYEVIAGLRTCCGWPQYLSGDVARAEELLEALGGLIDTVEPRVVVSGCAECVTAVSVLARRSGGAFESISTTEWLLRNRLGLDLEGSDDKVTVHDSCHLGRKLGRGDSARSLLAGLHPVEEMKEHGDDSLCCGYYGFDVNRVRTRSLRKNRLEQARATGAGTMAVECVTCQEAYGEVFAGSGVRVVELQRLVWEALERARDRREAEERQAAEDALPPLDDSPEEAAPAEGQAPAGEDAPAEEQAPAEEPPPVEDETTDEVELGAAEEVTDEVPPVEPPEADDEHPTAVPEDTDDEPTAPPEEDTDDEPTVPPEPIDDEITDIGPLPDVSTPPAGGEE